MSESLTFMIAVAGLWAAIGLVLSVVMGRRGHSGFSWLLLGAILGPLAFVLAIAQSPDDDSLRLMYADWLDDRGDPRGELIRVQCALARSSADIERTDLQMRERELLSEHSAEWVAPLSRRQTAGASAVGGMERSTRSPAQSAWSTGRMSRKKLGVSLGARSSATASLCITSLAIVAGSANARTTSRSGKLTRCSLSGTSRRPAIVRKTWSLPSRSQTSHQDCRPSRG